MFIPPTLDPVTSTINNLLNRANEIPAAAARLYMDLYDQIWAPDTSPTDMNTLLAALSDPTKLQTVVDPSTGASSQLTAIDALAAEGTWVVKWLQATRPDIVAAWPKNADGTKTRYINYGWDFDANGVALNPTVWVQGTI